MPQILVLLSLLLVAAIVASKVSSRFGIPALVLFAGLGMLAGEEGLGRIVFNDASLAQNVGVVSLSLILFSGGLGTSWKHVRRLLWRAVSLATVGVIVAACLAGWFASVMLGISLGEGLLLGSILASTDAAAVFTVLASSGITLRARLGPLLELESGSNDPMAVFLTVALIRFLTVPGAGWGEALGGFVVEMVLGLVLGLAGGRFGVWAINRIQLSSEGLYPVATVAIALGIFGGTMLGHGSGFLAVYVAGVVMNGASFVHKASLVRFHDGVAWLAQIGMFLTLGLLCFPSRLWAVAGPSFAISLFLILAARPVAVFVSLALAKMTWRQKTLVGWVGLRGAVPIVLATFPLLAKMPNAELYFNVVFFVVLTSVLVQGTTLGWLAGRLGLVAPVAAKTKPVMTELRVGVGAAMVGQRIMDLAMPKEALVVLVTRGEEFVVPRGDTRLQAGDTLQVLADGEDLRVLRLKAGDNDGVG